MTRMEGDGRMEGRKEGRTEGRKDGRKEGRKITYLVLQHIQQIEKQLDMTHNEYVALSL
jgi:predicted transposase YdaD